MRRGSHPQEQRVRQPHDMEVDELLPQPRAEVVQGDVPAAGGRRPLHTARRARSASAETLVTLRSPAGPDSSKRTPRSRARAFTFGPGGPGEEEGLARDRGGARSGRGRAARPGVVGRAQTARLPGLSQSWDLLKTCGYQRQGQSRRQGG